MRRLLAIVFALVLGGAAAAATAPAMYISTAVVPGTTACFPTTSPAGQLVIDSTGAVFRCDAGTSKYVRADLPACPANPPTGAAPTATAICKTTNAATIYGADGSGNWANMTGGGAAVAGSTSDVQINNAGVLDNAPEFTADATTGAVTTKIINNERQANAYRTGGVGTAADPWTGFETVFDSGPANVKFPCGHYAWNTTKQIQANSGTDRAGRWSVQGEAGGCVYIYPRVTPVLKIGPAIGATQGHYGAEVSGMTFALDQDLGYTHGIIEFERVQHPNIHDLALYGGPLYPGSGGTTYNSYTGYLLELDNTYGAGSVRNNIVYGRRVYLGELDDTTVTEELDTLHFDSNICQSDLCFITRASTVGIHNLLFTNMKYQTIISDGAHANQYDKTTLSALEAAGQTVLSVVSSSSFAADDMVLLGIGNTAELAKVSSVASGSITVSAPTRFQHAASEVVFHGGVGFSFTGSNRLVKFDNFMVEQCGTGVLSDGLFMLTIDTALSSCTEMVRIDGPHSVPGATTALWHATIRNAEFGRLPVAQTMYGIRVTAAGDSVNIREIEIDHMERNSSSDDTLVEFQNDAGTFRNYSLAKAVSGARTYQRHFPPSYTTSIDKIVVGGVTQHEWLGSGNYTAAGKITAGTAIGYPSGAYVSRPGSPATGDTYIVTDDSSAGSCTGGGTAKSFCRWSGSAWQAIGDGGSGGGGGSAAGVDHDVQVNSGASFSVSPGFTANTATGAVTTKILNGTFNVKGYGAVGDGSTNDYTAINATLTAAATSGGVVQFPSSTNGYKISTNITIPYNVTIRLEPGAVLKPDGGVTIRIQGPIDADAYQIFGGAGTVAIGPTQVSDVLYGPAGISEAPIQWWGCFPNTTADCGPAITTALNNVLPGTFLTFHGGTFKIQTAVSVTRRFFNMRGETGGYRPGTGYPTFIWDGADAGTMFTIINPDGITVENVAFDGDFSAATVLRVQSTDTAPVDGQPASGWNMRFDRSAFLACRGVCVDFGGDDPTYDEDYSQALFNQCMFDRPSGRASNANGVDLNGSDAGDVSQITAGSHFRIRGWNSYNVTFQNSHFFSIGTSIDADQDARVGIVAKGGYLRFEGCMFVNRGIDIMLDNPNDSASCAGVDNPYDCCTGASAGCNGPLPSQVEVYGGESQSAQFLKTYTGTALTSQKNSIISGFRHIPSIAGYTPGGGMVNSIYWDGPGTGQATLALYGNNFRKNVEIGTNALWVEDQGNVFAAGFGFTGNTGTVVGQLGGSGTAFPTNPHIGTSYIVTDDSVAGACNSSGGTGRTLCRWNGSAWLAVGVSDDIPLSALADITTDRLIGRDTAGSGAPEAITVDGTVVFTGSNSIGRAATTGDVVIGAGSNDAQIQPNVVAAGELAATINFSDGDLLDFGTGVSSATEGIMIPANATTCASATAEGQVCWEEDADRLWVGDGATAVQISGGAGYSTVEDETTPLTQRTTIGFVGAGVSCADTASKTVCTISAGAETNTLSTLTTGIVDNQVPMGTAADTVVYKTMPATGTDGCSGAGEALQYNTTTNTWTCLAGLGAGGTVDSVAGDTGGATTAAAITLAGGVGITTAQSAGTTVTATLALTELSTATFGAGAFTALTFDAGATDPVFTMGSNSVTVTGAATFNHVDGSIPSADLATVQVAQGGTGVTSLTDGGILIGGGSGTVVALPVATNGQIPVGDGTTAPVLATITGTANEITVTNGAGSITVDIPTNPTLAGANFSGIVTAGITDGTIAPADIDVTGEAWDFGATTSFELPNGAAPTVDAFGELAGDNDRWAASRGAPVFYDGTSSTTLVNVLTSDTPTNGQSPKWNTGGTITWEETFSPIDAASDTTTSVVLGVDPTGAQTPRTDAGLTYNSSTDTLTAAIFDSAASATSGGSLELKEDSDLGASRFIMTLGASNLTGDVTCTVDTNGRIPDSCVGDGTDGGGGGNTFETMNAPAGTDPVADLSTDTLNWAATSPVTITGDSTTDTLTVACPLCTTNAAALTSNMIVLGGGSQAATVLGSLGTTSQVLRGNAAGAPTWIDSMSVTLTTEAQGDVIHRNASGWVNLPPGTNGQVLTSGGAGANVSWSNAGVGDITAVGPGFASGAAFTDGVVSTGTTMLVWEGTTDNANQISILSPSADPGGAIEITVPGTTGTLALLGANTFTGAQTMTTETFVDALGAEFEPGDAITNCSTFAATGGGIFYDDSEGKLKKCQDNALTDLDTGGGTVTGILADSGGTTTGATIDLDGGIGLVTSRAADAVSVDFDYTETLTAETLGIGQCEFSSAACAGGGILCEGTSGAGQLALCMPGTGPTADRTITFPSLSGDVTVPLLEIGQTWTAANVFSSTATFNGATNSAVFNTSPADFNAGATFDTVAPVFSVAPSLTAGATFGASTNTTMVAGTTFANTSKITVAPSATTFPGTAIPSAWAASTSYTAGASGVSNDSGKQYRCITTGTSAGSGGPTGTGADITDGTAHWKYIGLVHAGTAKFNWWHYQPTDTGNNFDGIGGDDTEFGTMEGYNVQDFAGSRTDSTEYALWEQKVWGWTEAASASRAGEWFWVSTTPGGTKWTPWLANFKLLDTASPTFDLTIRSSPSVIAMAFNQNGASFGGAESGGAALQVRGNGLQYIGGSGGSFIQMDGATLNGNLTTLGVIDPTGTNDINFPDSDGTVSLVAYAETLTNKTIDAEGTGNVITTVEKLWLPAAACNNATAGPMWDLPTSLAPTPTCVAGTNTFKAYLDYPDTDGAYQAQMAYSLPSDWTGAIDVKIIWLSSITTGNAFWQVSTICVADAETDDPAFNTASTVADAAKGTTNQKNDATITGLTATGCAAGELMHLKVMRDRTNASDTLGAAAARLIGVELTMRRAQ